MSTHYQENEQQLRKYADVQVSDTDMFIRRNLYKGFPSCNNLKYLHIKFTSLDQRKTFADSKDVHAETHNQHKVNTIMTKNKRN